MKLLKKLFISIVLIFAVIKMPSVIYEGVRYANCISEESLFNFHWKDTGVSYIEVRCFKDNCQNLKKINRYRISMQDTVWGLYGLSFIDNINKFPNYVGADEQNWDYINKESTFVSFNLNYEDKSINRILFRGEDKSNILFTTSSIKYKNINSNLVQVVGDYKTIDLNTLQSFYLWCSNQMFHKKISECTYFLRSNINSRPDIIIRYIGNGERFYLDII
ncbi:hypothetical protein [Larkinella punicea]|uniref:Uncharacterized protein n=1 Tax=Larkinella punicea TaxID=2315727 RepID=A0A368JRI9_9BACT|nr:hypothetical protein [Larkinella punicea]RCR70248.1 hypothetical protein DUE52_07745 [Larkinella punicea]